MIARLPSHTFFLIAGIAAAALAFAAPATASEEDVLIEPGAVEYKAGPPSLPEGAEFAVIYGDPAAEAPFAMRLRLPADYHIPPHFHSTPEIVTVLSGNILLGMGEEANRDAATPLPGGSFIALQPGHAHYVYTDEETVLQLNSVGPWTLEYVQEGDDPRKTN